MKKFRRLGALFIAAVPMLAFGETKGAIKEAIEAKYAVSQPTNDHKDLTTPGAVIDLLKDDLNLATTAQVTTDADGNPLYANEPTSTYKNGTFEKSRASKFWGAGHNLVAGEKCWLIGVEIRDDGAVLEFLSDPINGARFRGFLRYPFPKGQIPAPEAVLQQIGETIKAEPMQIVAAVAPAAPVPAPPAAIPPPPPAPPDPPKPKTISLGQTKAQVSANFGTPSKIVTLPTKEIDFWGDMKVTFVKGKVVDIQ